MLNLHKLTKMSLLSLILFVSACAIAPKENLNSRSQGGSEHIQPYSVGDLPMKEAPVKTESAPGNNTDYMSEILAENKAILAATPIKESKYGKIELPINKYVKVWINYFTGRGRDHMTRYLARSSKYIPKMKKILIKEGLPEDLVYLPVIESGFYTRAKSIKGATGYWQFMPGSGRDFGLTINHLVDERQDYVRSTEAAAKYLKKLYILFGDWKLALSAYNAGENRVKRQLANAETRDYWTLVKRKALYRETREYVPKFIAATLIAKNPIMFGFVNIPYQAEYKYQSMYVKKPVNLRKLSKHMKVPFSKMKKLNPRYRTYKVPVYKGGSSLVRVPTGTLAKAQIAAVKSHIKIPKKIYRPLVISKYRVRKGDNLTKIARKFKVSVKSLRRTNSLKRSSVLYVGRTLKVVRPSSRRKTSSVITAKASRNYRKIKKVHKVARGESLSIIAKRYKVSLSKLLKYNNIKINKNLYVGQKIKLTKNRVARKKRNKSIGKVVTYKVKAGDNLQKISKRFGTSVHQLKKSNGLRSSKITVEQKLKIVVDNIKMHIVRRGDSLIAIANKYKVSMSKILRVNDLKHKSKIQIGKILKIPQARIN